MPTLATACTHTDRPMKALGLCKSCWSKGRRQSGAWAKKPIVADPSSPRSVAARTVKAPSLGAAVQKAADRAAAKQAKSVATLTAAAAATAPATAPVASTAPDPAPSPAYGPGDGVGPIQDDDLAPAYGPVPAGKIACPDCGLPQSKANLARHRARRHQ